MASSALEAKINKIRQQNEEIRRRYEEVEEDKKNAAKSNALVQMVPSTDWPERKEPPEFSNPPRSKQKPTKEKHEYISQSYPAEGKKVHSFAQGEGPPPDPKYNFLADSEREETGTEYSRENVVNRIQSKVTRGNFRKKMSARDGMQRDNKIHKANHRDDYQPGYDAWRAERNRIDEDRISRQRTAEGNWRREWDNDKMHVADDATRTRPTLGDFAKKDHKDFDRRYHPNGSDHASHNRVGNHRLHRGSSKNFHGNYENRSHTTYEQHRHSASMKVPLSPTSEDRTVIATDKSLKVTLNQGNLTKGPVMSVKVNSTSIAGTGRVGPRQRTRVTYSHSDAEVTTPEIESFPREKSFDDKSKASYFNSQKSPNLKRSFSQKKKEVAPKSPYLPRRDSNREEIDAKSHYENEIKSYPQKDAQKSQSASKSPRLYKGIVKPTRLDSSNADFGDKKEIDEIVNKSDEILNEECAISMTNLDADFKEDNVLEINENLPEVSQCVSPDIEEYHVETEEEFNAKDKIVLTEEKKIEDTKEAITKEETIELALAPQTATESLEKLPEKATIEEQPGIENESSNEIVHSPSEEVSQEKCNLSSDESLKDAQVSETNESNNVLEDITELQVVESKDDEQSQSEKEISSETFVSDNNCDNIKDEATDEQPAAEQTIEALVNTSVAETCSVIEAATDQATCSGEDVQEETADARTGENDEENVDDSTDCKVELEKDTVIISRDANTNENLEDKVESPKKNLVETENNESKMVQETNTEV